ncbi:hypothetical protein ACF0H5_023487 [Mactra antiquata]
MGDQANIQRIILCFLFVSLAQASQKKGISGWSGFYKCEDFKALNNVTWMYDWHKDLSEIYLKHMTKINCPRSTYEQYLPEYVPMIYTFSNNSGHQHFQHFPNASRTAKYILGFNEPDHTDQANMTPREAADRWPDIEKANPGIPLVSPAPAGANLHWLENFFHLCHGCRVDYVAAHSYACNTDKIMNYLHTLYQRFGKKVWLTEFACPHTNDRNVQLRFMKEILPRLEAADYVFRYSWFQARIYDSLGGGFMTSSASLFWPNSPYLNPLGHFYNDFHLGQSPQVIG